MSEKRKASGGLVPEDVAEEKKVKGSPKAQDSNSGKVDEKLGTVSLDNIEEDDEFQEFEVYSTSEACWHSLPRSASILHDLRCHCQCCYLS